MITVEDVAVSFQGMGLFETDEEWIHPERTECTYELIVPVSGTVYLEEEGQEHVIEKGQLRILRPHMMHRGSRTSVGRTSFYWLHFLADELPEALPLAFAPFSQIGLLRELLHYSTLPIHPPALPDAILAHLLLLVTAEAEMHTYEGSKLSGEVFEWVRINASADLHVSDVASRFGYHPEHLSKLMRERYHTGLKALICDQVLRRAKDLLCNTNDSVKQIANRLGFRNENAFIHFYKYHEHTTPARFRNGYFSTHMNKK